MNLDNLKEMLHHPGWVSYLDVVESEMVTLFSQMMQLDPSQPIAFSKFIELKSKIDAMRDITYFIERQVVDQSDRETVKRIDTSYFDRLISMFKKIWRK